LGRTKIAVIPGDGIGREVIQSAIQVVDYFVDRRGLELEYDKLPYSADHYLSTGLIFSEDDASQLAHDYSHILIGAFGDPRVSDGRHAKNLILGLRQKLDLYVNFRPLVWLDNRLFPLKQNPNSPLNLVIIRENTEGLYCRVGGKFKPGTDDEIGIEEMVTTRKGVQRILNFAVQFAHEHGRRKITMVDKSNVLKHGHEIWRRTFAELKMENPNLIFEHLYIDVAAMRMVRNPDQFDIVVTENLFGDILSDLAAELQGGLGFAPSVNFRPGGPYLYEPVHGSAPDIAGKDVANPIAALLSLGLMLLNLNRSDLSSELTDGIRRLLERGVVTQDVFEGREWGSPVKTGEFTTQLLEWLEMNFKHREEGQIRSQPSEAIDITN